jgi:hypothetical protein
VVVSVELSEQTVAQLVCRPGEPPALVISDGSAVVWCRPLDSPAGLGLAVEFADRLVAVAGRWSDTCREWASPARHRPFVRRGTSDHPDACQPPRSGVPVSLRVDEGFPAVVVATATGDQPLTESCRRECRAILDRLNLDDACLRSMSAPRMVSPCGSTQ